MIFQLNLIDELVFNESVGGAVVDYVDDDPESLVFAICEFLADSEKASFIVNGFGDERWPVDIRTDLPVFLQQVVPAIKALRTNENIGFTIDFYEQGIERAIVFALSGPQVTATCRSSLDWQPNPSSEQIPRTRLLEMLQCTLVKFLDVARCTTSPRQAEQLRRWAALAEHSQEN